MKSLIGRILRRLRRSRLAAAFTPVARHSVARKAITASGLFDAAWYAAEIGGLPDRVDPLEHFLRVGGPQKVSPSPLFVTDWYVARRRAARRARFGPFADYVLTGARAGVSPHPLFSVQFYLQARPGAGRNPLGALGDYLDAGWREGVSPHPDFDVEQSAGKHPDADEPPLLDLARAGGELLRLTRGTEHHRRTSDRFDRGAADRLVARVLSGGAATAGDAPLVTVVIPTKNRAASVAEAVQSVFAQTYPHWQLVVSDDGSDDGTEEALAPFLADARVEYVHRRLPAGVAAARNTALTRARGTYVAYLDSDNTWVPHFLEVMVGVLRSTGARAAYAVSELRERAGRRRVAWRAAPFDREALVERNYVDCIVVVHERTLLDEVGMFDESLRRAVDWDLWIRMSAVTDLVHVPFVATVYDPWDNRDDRITRAQPMGYRNAVIAKHLVDWDAERARSRDPDLLSIIVPAVGATDNLVSQVRRLAEVTEDRWELVIVDAAGAAERLYRLLLLEQQIPGVRLERLARRLPSELAINVGIMRTHGSDIVILDGGLRVERGWERPLREALRSGAAAAQGLLLDADGTVASAGLVFAPTSPGQQFLAGLPGDAPEVQVAGARPALTSKFLAVGAQDVVAVRAFDGVFLDDLGNGDLSLRLAEATGKPLVYVPASVASMLEGDAGRASGAAAGDNLQVFEERWRGRLHADAAERWSTAGYDLIPSGPDRPIGVVRRRDRKPLRWALKIGPPTVARRESWGDWHFALALKGALERLGQEVVIDCRDAWYRGTAGDDDIVLVVRGVARYEPDSRHLNLLWVISHPEQVDQDEVAGFDAAFAASELWAARFTGRYGLPVEPLLQCTDGTRFRPVEPDPVRKHPVLFVGNARGVRTSVRTALEAGLDVAVYGVRWNDLLPPGSWQASYVPNDELPALYRAAGVVLNDHWDDMRANGFVSNRLFDLAACGARIISDEMPGLYELFGPSVLTFDSPSSMAEAVCKHASEGPDEIANRERLSVYMSRNHSFDSRAARLVEVAAKLLAAPSSHER